LPATASVVAENGDKLSPFWATIVAGNGSRLCGRRLREVLLLATYDVDGVRRFRRFFAQVGGGEAGSSPLYPLDLAIAMILRYCRENQRSLYCV